MAPSIPTGQPLEAAGSRPPTDLDGPVVLTLRPRATLIRDGSVAVLALTLPILGALFFINLPEEVWLLVVILGVVIVTVFIGSVRGFGRTGVWATDTEFVERGFFGTTTHVRFSEVASIVTIQAPVEHERESTDQLFALSADGRSLLRLRGQFWTRATIQSFIRHSQAPVTVIDDSDAGEVYMQAHPEQLYWFERQPLLARVLVGGLAIASVIAGIYLVATLSSSIG